MVNEAQLRLFPEAARPPILEAYSCVPVPFFPLLLFAFHGHPVSTPYTLFSGADPHVSDRV